MTPGFARILSVICLVSAMLPPASAAEVSQAEILRRLEKLEQSQQENLRQLRDRDQRIEELEQQLRASGQIVSERVAAQPTTPAVAKKVDQAPEQYGQFIPGRGFMLANTDVGSVSFSAFTYLRYLNQENLDDTYTDSFGRTKDIDARNDLQLQKVMLYFKGWVYDPNLRYVTYVWTSNTSQGDGAQVVVGGYLGYHFDDAFTLSGGIGGLPGTRSMEGQWPNLLKVDYRTIADEYFRGSYTSGLFADGVLAPGLQYKAMLGNNLSQLGVSASQMDNTFDTFAGAIWWMPTTGEYGPNQGFGDFEFHDRFATRVGFHYSHSTEERQSQPGKDDPENTQIRLSDGTAIFDINGLAPGVQINRARYQMATLDAGFKYQGFALEGEYYYRLVDDLHTSGDLTIDEFIDRGFQLQASMMLVPKTWQLYVSGSKIYGEYGDPYDVALGTNWFPLQDNRKLRLNAELLYLYDSPVGYTSVPFTVGGNGTVFNTNMELAF